MVPGQWLALGEHSVGEGHFYNHCGHHYYSYIKSLANLKYFNAPHPFPPPFSFLPVFPSFPSSHLYLLTFLYASDHSCKEWWELKLEKWIVVRS